MLLCLIPSRHSNISHANEYARPGTYFREKFSLKWWCNKIFFQCNHIHREIDQWNRRRFGAKWNVTVPNSVTPIKPIVCEWIYMLLGWYFKMTRELHIYKIFIRIFVKLWFWAIFTKFITKNAVFCRLVHQELNVAYETSIFFVNVHIAQIFIKTIILKKRN